MKSDYLVVLFDLQTGRQSTVKRNDLHHEMHSDVVLNTVIIFAFSLVCVCVCAHGCVHVCVVEHVWRITEQGSVGPASVQHKLFNEYHDITLQMNR